MTKSAPAVCLSASPEPGVCGTYLVHPALQGGNIGFFQALCLLGYCLFPIDIAAVVSVLVHLRIVR